MKKGGNNLKERARESCVPWEECGEQREYKAPVEHVWRVARAAKRPVYMEWSEQERRTGREVMEITAWAEPTGIHRPHLNNCRSS